MKELKCLLLFEVVDQGQPTTRPQPEDTRRVTEMRINTVHSGTPASEVSDGRATADSPEQPNVWDRVTADDYEVYRITLDELVSYLDEFNNLLSQTGCDDECKMAAAAADENHCLMQYTDTYLDALLVQHQQLKGMQRRVLLMAWTATPAPSTFVGTLNDVEKQCEQAVERLTRLRHARTRLQQQTAERQALYPQQLDVSDTDDDTPNPTRAVCPLLTVAEPLGAAAGGPQTTVSNSSRKSSGSDSEDFDALRLIPLSPRQSTSSEEPPYYWPQDEDGKCKI